MSSEVFMWCRKYIFDENIRKALRSFKLVPLGMIVGTIIVFGYYYNIKNKELSQVFNGVDDCIINNPTLKIECESAYYNALTEAAQTAPRYNSKSACESDFGISQCIKSPESFMPIMSGFSLKKLQIVIPQYLFIKILIVQTMGGGLYQLDIKLKSQYLINVTRLKTRILHGNYHEEYCLKVQT